MWKLKQKLSIKNLQQIKAHQPHHLLKISKLGGIWIQLLGQLIENLKKVITDTLVNWCELRELKEWLQWQQWEQQKSNRFRLAKQQLCMCIMLFCTFLCHRCTTTMWKCINSCTVVDGNTRQQLSFSFPELWYSPLEFNWWLKQDGINAIKFEAVQLHFFKWRFHSRCHCCCLSPLICNELWEWVHS